MYLIALTESAAVTSILRIVSGNAACKFAFAVEIHHHPISFFRHSLVLNAGRHTCISALVTSSNVNGAPVVTWDCNSNGDPTVPQDRNYTPFGSNQQLKILGNKVRGLLTQTSRFARDPQPPFQVFGCEGWSERRWDKTPTMRL